MEILARRLIMLRNKKDVSRKVVAEAVKISERTYQRYENAEREPTVSVLAALADYYNVSLDYLVGRTDEV